MSKANRNTIPRITVRTWLLKNKTKESSKKEMIASTRNNARQRLSRIASTRCPSLLFGFGDSEEEASEIKGGGDPFTGDSAAGNCEGALFSSCLLSDGLFLGSGCMPDQFRNCRDSPLRFNVKALAVILICVIRRKKQSTPEFNSMPIQLHTDRGTPSITARCFVLSLYLSEGLFPFNPGIKDWQ